MRQQSGQKQAANIIQNICYEFNAAKKEINKMHYFWTIYDRPIISLPKYWWQSIPAEESHGKVSL